MDVRKKIMSGECEKCHEHWLDCKCKDNISYLIDPQISDYIIKVEGYETRNPRIIENIIWIDVLPKWISVEERLPENFKRVLAYAIHGSALYLNCNYFEATFNGDFWYECVDSCRICVTHWMPLPTPPEK